MRISVVVVLYFIININFSFGQFTPNCTDISAYVIYPAPLTQAQINSINAAQQSQFPNVVKLAEPTSAYNCHNYAFVKSEGGSDFWLNSPGDDAFWNDGSYIVTTNTGQANLKVSYQGDHSAVTNSTTNQAISKWGAWGLYRHNLTDVPSSYLPHSALTYYRRNLVMNGSSFVCTSNSTFSIQSPPNTTVQWNTSGNITIVSGQGTNNLTVRATNNANGAAGSLTATISGECGNATVTRDNIWVGTPTVTVSGPPNVCPSPLLWHTFTAYASGNPNSYHWNLPGDAIALNDVTWERTLHLNFDSDPPVFVPYDTRNLHIAVSNPCGQTNSLYTIQFPCCCTYSSELYLMAPNPANSFTEIVVREDPKEGLSISEKPQYNVKIIDSYGTAVYSTVINDNSFRVDTSKLMDGVYIIHIEDDISTYHKRLLVKH